MEGKERKGRERNGDGGEVVDEGRVEVLRNLAYTFKRIRT